MTKVYRKAIDNVDKRTCRFTIECRWRDGRESFYKCVLQEDNQAKLITPCDECDEAICPLAREARRIIDGLVH